MENLTDREIRSKIVDLKHDLYDIKYDHNRNAKLKLKAKISRLQNELRERSNGELTEYNRFFKGR